MLKTKFWACLISLIAVTGLISCVEPENSAQLFTRKPQPKNAFTYNKDFSNYAILNLDSDVLDSVFQSPVVSIDVPIINDESIKLNLTPVDMFDGRALVVNTDTGRVNDIQIGKFYSGKIQGEPSSLATISILSGEVTGMVSSDRGEINIGKTPTADYMVFKTDDRKVPEPDFICASPDSGYTTPQLEQLRAVEKYVRKKVQSSVGSNCISIDFEVTYSAIQSFGSVQAVVTWLTNAFQMVKQLYAVEGINVSIKSIYVWTTPDGYSTNAATALNEVSARRKKDPAFTGNFTQLIRLATGGLSGIAYVGTTCFNDYRFSHSIVVASTTIVNDYTWTIEVITHELGHNFGSPHTQWCGWSGGAIDNCYTTEGGCPPGPAPVDGGTIMSYCHLTNYRIKFKNGFGPQPRQKMLDLTLKSSCLDCATPAPPVANCTDGIKNGTETGIDCGGSCPPCPVVPPGGGTVVSRGKSATQSSTYMPNTAPYPASRVNDGNSTGTNNFNHTLAELRPWVQIDLGQKHSITGMKITNRVGCPSCVGRLKTFRVTLTDAPISTYPTSYVFQYSNETGAKDGEVISSGATAAGRYFRLWSDNGSVQNYLHLAEIELTGKIAENCRDTIIIRRDTTITMKRDTVRKCD